MNSSLASVGAMEQAIVYVIDDDDSLRVALAGLLRSAGFHAQVHASADALLDGVLPDVPSCLVLDVRLRGVNGLDLQRRLAERNNGLPIIFMTGHADVAMAVRAMKAGAVDFLSKPFRDQDLLDAVSSALADNHLHRDRQRILTQVGQRYESLSEREKRVMQLAVSGMMNKNIASELELSEITIKIYRRNAMRKMHAKTFAHLVQLAAVLGMTA